ncbi:MAG: PKD domain-containing protein, partial [Bacteroidota bacterium]
MSTFLRVALISLMLLASERLQAQVNASFTTNLPSPACNPAVVGFSNSSTGVAPLTYAWNFGVYGGTNSVLENPFTTYLGCGTYTVTLIVTNGLGQSDTATEDITIYCTPDADFSVSNLIGCAPFNTTYTDLSTPNSGTIASVEWDFGDGFLGDGLTTSHTYYAIGCNTVTQIVTNSFGCKATKTVTGLICVQQPPVATFTSTTPTSCAAPFQVTFSDQTTGGTGPYSYEWNFNNATPPTDTTANPTVQFNNTGSSGVTLVITDQNGCLDTVDVASYINIANNTINIVGSPLEGCAPYLYQPLGTANNPVQNWSWTVNPGNLTGSGQTPSFNLLTPGTYDVCLTATFSGACVATICKKVLVNPPPVSLFSVNGPDSTCVKPTSITFNNLSVGDTLSYSWAFPGATPASYNDSLPSSITYSNCGSYNALLTVTDINGCTASSSQNNIITIECPVANFTAQPTTGCVPLTASFNSSGSTGDIVSYEWSFGDPSSGGDNNSTDPNPSHTFNSQGCYSVTLIITTDEGCKDTITIPNAVCAGTPPEVDFTVNSPFACADDLISFTNLTDNTYPYTTYIWDFIGVPPYDNMSNGINPSHTYNDTGTFDVTLIASNYGCNDTLTIYDMVNLFPPIAGIQLSRNCATPYTVTLSGATSVGADNYVWVLPGGSPSTAVTPTVTVTYPGSGNYNAILFVTNDLSGCDNQAQISIPIRDVEAYFTGNPLQGCVPLTSCMSNTSVDAVSYQWTVFSAGTSNVIATSTQTNPCFILTTPGLYDVRLIATDIFGCKDTLTKPSYITVWGPIVNFIGNPLQGCTPLVVQFTDQSTAPTSTIVSWNWNFGDPASGSANTSTLQNPSHTYNSPGFYSVTLTVTDDKGCTRTITKNNYINPVKPNADFTLSKTALCYGEVACFTNASSGTGLTYFWDFGNGSTSTQAAPCITYYASGSYNITLYIQDQFGCKDTIVKPNYVTVTKPTADFIADTTNSTCPPLLVTFSNLSTNIDANTSYFWDFGDNSVSIAQNPFHIYNLPGSYTVTLIVTNENGCKDTIVFPNYIVIGGPQGSVANPVTSGCTPLNACFTAVAPTAIFYIWNFGDGTVMPDDDSVCYEYDMPGVYNPELILDDGLGCIYALPIGEIVVGGLFSELTVSTDSICGPGTIEFFSNVTTNTTINSYSWNFGDPASGVLNTSNAINPTHYYGTPGNYEVTLIVNSVDGCSDTETVQITVFPVPVADFFSSDVVVCPPSMISFTNMSTSTLPIVSYLWNFGNPASGVGNTSFFPFPSHFYTVPGTYDVTLTVTDSYGCSDDVTYPITVYPLISITATPTQNICNGTDVVLSASGAVEYEWTPADGLNATNTAAVLASPTASVTYTVIGTSEYGCIDITDVVVNVLPSPQIDSILIVGDTCAQIMGSASVFISNGIAPYSYNWNNGNTTNSIINVSGGLTYTVTVTDAQNCSLVTDFDIPIFAPAILTSTIVHATCESNNGSIVLTVNGGQAPFQFIWSNGSTTKDLTDLFAGSYTVTVTDAFNCSSVSTIVVNNIASPLVSINTVNATCGLDNAIVQVAIIGGTAPFNYLWNTSETTETLGNLAPNTYEVTVTDLNGCTGASITTIINIPGPSLNVVATDATCQAPNGVIDLIINGGTAPMIIDWNNGFSFSEDLTAVYSGTYQVLVTDDNNCIDSIAVTINDTPLPEITVSTTLSTCGNSNGAIDVTVTGGIAPFTFLWSNGTTTEDLSLVSAGLYTISVTSDNGCVLDSIISLNNIGSPTLAVTTINSTCEQANGSASVTVSGGTSPFTYLWSNGSTETIISNLLAGSYDITVTDGNSCETFITATVENTTGPSVNLLPISSTCGADNGGVSLITSGGTAPFTFIWSNAATTQDINNVFSGSYSVTVSDGNGCTTIASVDIDNTDGPVLAYTTIAPTCLQANGGINTTISGGAIPYTYLWSNGATSSSISNVQEGIYSITITDNNNCVTIESINLENIPEPELTLDGNQPGCGLDNGIILSSVSGFGPLTFIWNTGNTNESLINIAAGSYTLTVTDIYGCTTSKSFTLTDNGSPVISPAIQGALCSSANGSIDLSIAGGTAPYTFLWSTLATTEDIDSLAEGIYFVTVTDVDGCSTTSNFLIENTPGPSATNTSVDATCGQQNGSINVTVFGGNSPFDFMWSNNATTASLSSLASGDYVFTITDANGCNTSDTISIDSITGPTLVALIQPETCSAGNGSILIDLSGGQAPFTFNWNNYAYTSEDLANISSGLYALTITDANGCETYFNDSVTNTPGPDQVLITQTPSTCGQANAQLIVSVSGGTLPYTYLWNNAATTDTLSSVSGNATYTVTVIDSNNCPITDSIFVQNIDGPSVAGVVTNTTCGLTNGAVDLTVSSGTAPYTFSWSNGATTEDIEPLSADTVTVIVTDALNCSQTLSFTVDTVAIPVLTFTAVNTSCGLTNGSIDVTLTNGQAPFMYDWNNSAYATQDLTGLSSGNYNLVFIDDNNCTLTLDVTLTDTPAPTVLLEGTPSICGFANAEVSAQVSGGTAPYTYTWNTFPVSTDSFVVSIAGNMMYNVTVTDSNNCIITDSIFIANIPGPSIDAQSNELSCINGTGFINLNLSNGTAPFTYEWNTGSSDQNLSGLIPGNYFVIVTDSNGCQAISVTNIDSVPPYQVTLNAVDPTCGIDNGSIDVQIDGTNGPFELLWNTNQTALSLTGLTAGAYTVTITDTFSCAYLDTILLVNNGLPVLSSFVTNEHCGLTDGTATVSIQGGTMPYSILWSNGATDTTANDLAVGTYSVTVTDAGNCSATLDVVVGSSTGPEIIYSATDAICQQDNGAIEVTVTSVFPYTVLWSNGETTEDLINLQANSYTITVTDTAGCSVAQNIIVATTDIPMLTADLTQATCATPNGAIQLNIGSGTIPYTIAWNTGSSAIGLNNLSGGVYTVTVSDANACSLADTFTISAIPVFTLTTQSTPEACNQSNGTASASVNGTTSPYTYLWNNGVTSQNIANLSAGAYAITVTDSIGCTVSEAVIITSAGGPNINAAVDDITCTTNFGSIQLNITGGTAPYTYNWSNGVSTTANTNLTAGTYQVTVTDNQGCSTSANYTINAVSAPLIDFQVTQPTCGLSNGALSISISGGANPYTVIWNNGATANAINNLPQGNYSVTVSDASGCSASNHIILNPSNAPNLIVSASDDSICVNSNVTLTVTGASSYVWAPAQFVNNSTGTEVVASVTTSTTFSVTGTDANGCSSTASIPVIVIATPQTTIAQPAVICAGTATSIQASGNYTFAWSGNAILSNPSASQITVQPVTTTTYYVQVTDAYGCTAQDSTLVLVTDAPVVLADTVVACEGASVTLSVSGADAYVWYNTTGGVAGNGTSITVNAGTSTNFTVIGTNANGCSDTTVATLTVQPLPDVSIDGLADVYCLNSSDIILNGTPAGGTFSGQGVSNNIWTISSLSAGNYIVYYQFTDSYGCADSVQQSITVNALPSIVANTGTPFICQGSSVNLTAAGANSYTWSPSSTLNSSTGSSVSAAPQTSTTYTVTGTDNNGCTANATVAVQVGGSIAIDLATGNPSVCVGSGTTLSVSGAASYSWLPATGLSASTGSTVSVLPLQTTTYTITGIDQNGCSGTATVIVTVNPLPVVTSTPDTGICNGSALVLEASGASSYAWTNGSLNLSGSTVSVNASANTIWTVIGTDSNGCTASSTTQVDVLTNPLVSATSGKICLGGSASLTAAGAATYSWSPSTGLTASTGSGVTASPLSSQTYTIVGTSAEGCTAVAYSVLTVDPIPAVSFSGINTDYCLSSNAVALNGQPSGGTFSGPGISGSSFIPQTAGVGGPYTIVYSYTDNNGCSASDTQLVSIFANPVIQVNNATACVGAPANLIAGGATTYTWSPEAGLNTTTGSAVQVII